jgi:hypothetical protein
MLFHLILVVSLCNLIFLIICKSIVLDSSILTVNVDNMVVNEIDFKTAVIDYAFDDFLYVSTSNYLYKIDPSELLLIDKTPLPLRFNHLMLKGGEVMLIATDEIIILDRRNLAFKSGVGIEQGDSRPLVKNQSFAALAAKDNIYLVNDAPTKSTVRIIDARSGRLLKEVHMDRIKSSDYDAKTHSFVILDVRNNILLYDINMNRQRKIELRINARSCIVHPDGFLVYFDQGILLINEYGKLIDFQPILLGHSQDDALVLGQEAVVCLDDMALRPNGYLPNQEQIVQSYPCANCDFELGIDRMHNFYLLSKEPLEIKPLAKKGMELRTSTPAPAAADSLWYLQIGAFASAINAAQVYDELRDRGIPVFVDSTALYRVKFGGFTDKLSGLNIAERMNLKGWFVYEQRTAAIKFEEFHVGPEKFSIRDGIVRKE